MSSNKKFKVYKHTNRENGKVYIGITHQNAERRWQKGAGYERTYFGNAVKKYGWDAFDHEILADNLTEDEAKAKEIELIAQFHSNDRVHGYNLSKGGDWMYCGNKSGAEHPLSKAVVKIDPETGERQRFETMTEAEKVLGFDHRCISKACRGILRTYRGFIWEYADINYEKESHRCSPGKYPHKHQWKKVRMIDLDGTEYIFDSIKSAANIVGANPHNVSRYVNGLRKDQSGRRWSLALD